MPPTGWLNDPCAPGYDAVHEVYHVGFQWNPKEPEWGNISWGSALSKDLLVWDIGNLPSIEPSAKPDGEAGVFTGCWSPATTVPGRSTAFYTSARMLPIHHTLPYNWGSEAICVATTADAGRTWQRGHTSIVLQGPPQHLQVTGWRDPFVAQWPSLSRLIGEHSDKTSFGIVSGGIRHVGPAIFLYSLSQNDVTDWNFVSVLSMAPTLRNAPTSHWEPDYGANWEVVNFLSLPDPDDAALSHDVLVIGVEGREQVPTKTSGRYRHSEFRRDHSQMWVSGTLVKTSAGIQMKFRSGAALDYGAMYAVNSFHDPKTNQQIAFGWIVEEDLPIELRKIQGWAGLLSVPRAVQLKRIRHVVKALKSELASIKSFDVVLEEDNPQQMGFAHAGCPETYTLTTLCALPDPRLKGLRHTQRSLRSATHRSSPGALGSLDFPLGCSCWEVDVLFDIGADIESIGFVISHTKGKPSTWISSKSHGND
jgi:beta-fructofuranosidase